MRSEVNMISPKFTQKLGFKIRNANISIQKIVNTILEIYGIIISIFLLLNKDSKERFFKKTFLLVNVSLYIILGIFFVIMNNVDINF